MELLELQARARAIRSQLALEPVTKIELDSDNDSVDSSSPKVGTNSKSTATTSDNNKDQTHKAKSSSKDIVQETNGMQIIKPSIPAVKPVRLKRNFRQRQNDDYDPDEDDETNPVENSESKEAATKSGDEKDEKTPDSVKLDEKKRDEAERSPSPDLIPIIQEPETYCISSDSDEAGSSSVPKYITYPTVVREKLPETEDEKFLKKIKEGSGVDLRDLIKARRGGKQDDAGVVDNSETIDTSNDATHGRPEITTPRASSPDKNLEEISVKKSEENLDKDSEPEEGELTDGDDQNETNAIQITILSSDDENDEKSDKCDSGLVTQAEHNVSENIEDDETSSESSTSANDSDTDSSDVPAIKEADDDDDIIDLGKDEELDFEMKEVEQKKTKNKKIKKSKKKLTIVDKSSETGSEATEAVKIIEETIDNEDISQCIETTEPTENNDPSKEIEPATVADPSEVTINYF